MPIEKLRPSFTFNEDRIKELKKIAPEAFADGKINWETLREALGEYLEDDAEAQEHFGLFWPGKRQARRMAAVPSKGTLVPVYGEGLKGDGTPDSDGFNDSHNIFIEGENLEVLKILQKAYAGKIKMIYIDPPYNTGNDFVYDDNFTEPLQEYLRRTGQVDEEGQPLTTNKRADGRFHSKWLSMMYPRLRLAKSLLSDEGVIFISIDDNEIHNLKTIMNEIFGEENFKGIIIWQHSIQPKGYTGKFSVHHNFILCYANSPDFSIGNLSRTKEHNKNYSNPDNDPNGSWRSGDVRNALYRKNLIYDLHTPSGKIINPPKNGWRWSKQTMFDKIKSGEIIFNKDETNIIRKIYLKNLEGRTPETIWFGKDVGTTRDGINELKKLFAGNPPFDTPKPASLIERMFEIADLNEGDLILDFFGGSSTTAQSVLQNNFKKNKKLKYIIVQLQEKVDISTPAGINAKNLNLLTISDISKERIRRYSASINTEKYVPKNDIGFKIFRLTISNYSEWRDYKEQNILKLETLFDQFETPLRENWTEQGLLTESLLIEGFPLDSSIETLAHFKANKIRKITSEFCDHALLVCFDEKINDSTIGQLDLNEKDIFICLDSAISDQEKLRLADKGLIKTV